MERELLLELIEQARRRLASRRAWRWGGRTGLVGAAAALVAALAQTVVPLDLPAAALAAAGLAAGIVVALAAGVLVRPSPLWAAQVLDYRCGLADRLATAVEVISGRHLSTALTEAAVADAAAHAAVLDLRRTVRSGPDRSMTAALGLALAAVLAAEGLGGLSLPGTPAREVARAIQREGKRLERVGETMEERARAERARITRRLVPELRALGEAFQRERLGRSGALARIESLARKIEDERRRVADRRQQSAGGRSVPATPGLPHDLFRQRAGVEHAIRQIREIAERLAQSRSPEEREALMRQLAALAGGGEDGDVPARAREQAEAARQQLAAGDVAGARRTLHQTATDLEELRAMLADEEGLTQAQRELRRSADQIAGARAPTASEENQVPHAEAQPGATAPGSRPVPQGGPEGAEPPPGPHQGTTPGQGTITEKLGERTPRLEGNRQQSRLQGLQGEGRVTISDLLGPGRPGQVRIPAGPLVAAARSEADRYLSRRRIPPEYREIVRRYFEVLATTR